VIERSGDFVIENQNKVWLVFQWPDDSIAQSLNPV